MVVARQLARSARPHDLEVTADRDDDRRARQLRIAHERARGGCRDPRPVARPARSAAWRGSPSPSRRAAAPGARSIRPSVRAAQRIVSPCAATDSTTTKNTASKTRDAPGTPAATGKVASTMGTPPRRPAQARKPCSRSDTPNGVAHTQHRQRAGDEHERDRDEDGPEAFVQHARGRDEQAEQHEQPELREPGGALQEAAHDRRVRDARVADDEADEIGGKQARAVQERDADGAGQRDGHRDHRARARPKAAAGGAAARPRRCRRAVRRSPRCRPGGQAAAARRRCRSRSCSTRPGRSRATRRTGR